jgi:hypothetical protein
MHLRHLLLASAMIGALACGSDDPTSEPAGTGGQLAQGGSGGTASTGGNTPTAPTCDCTLAPLACAPDACASTLPTLAMDELVVQAQVEPFRGDQPTLPGDAAVELVQAALGEEAFAVSVDGWFGNETADAYAGWQIQLGYSGLAANAIPGPSSLAELGADRFVIEQPIVVGGHTSHSGRTVNQRTKDMIVAAEGLLGYGLVVTQGSYNAGGVSASAGTHDGGGTVDISVLNKTATERWQVIQALRTVGFAAWLRTPSQGNWPYHVHAIAVGDTDVSNSARNQIADYFVGLNGLASHAADNTPQAYQVPFTWWERYLLR